MKNYHIHGKIFKIYYIAAKHKIYKTLSINRSISTFDNFHVRIMSLVV